MYYILPYPTRIAPAFQTSRPTCVVFTDSAHPFFASLRHSLSFFAVLKFFAVLNVDVVSLCRDLLEEGVDLFAEIIQDMYEMADTENEGFISRDKFIAVSILSLHALHLDTVSCTPIHAH